MESASETGAWWLWSLVAPLQVVAPLIMRPRRISTLEKLISDFLMGWLPKVSETVIGQLPRVIRRPIQNTLLNKMVASGSTYIVATCVPHLG